MFRRIQLPLGGWLLLVLSGSLLTVDLVHKRITFNHNLFVFSCLKQPQRTDNLRLLLFCLSLNVAEAIFIA